METIYDWQERLKRRSILLLFINFLYLTILLTLIFLYLTGDVGFSFILGGAFSLAGVGIETWKVYNSPQSIVAAISGARKSGNKRLNEIVEKMEIAYGIKNVETYIVPWSIINAFTVSKRDKHYLFVTLGALEKLSDEELENVIAHEFAHMEHGDSFIMTLAVIVAGFTVLIGYYFLRLMPRVDSEEGENLRAVALLLAILMIALSPIITRLLVSALSKEREFLADARAVQVTKYPPGLINTLIKVAFENSEEYVEKAKVPKIFGALFFDFEDIDTHPPVYERVERLSRLTKTPVDEEILKKLREMGV